MALAATGADVLAVEFDASLVPALEEVVGGVDNVRIVRDDAMRLDWPAVLGPGPWVLCANLPYNLATPLVLDLLVGVPAVERFVVMVQRELGERSSPAPVTMPTARSACACRITPGPRSCGMSPPRCSGPARGWVRS